MDNLTIRKAIDSDFQNIKELVNQLYDGLDVKDGKEKDFKIDKFKKFLKDPRLKIYVADIDGKVIGYLTINFNKALLDIGTTAIIDELVVHKNYRGRGIGNRLVDNAVRKARELGCSEIGVGTECENEKAREFYKRCGFDEIGVILEKHFVKKD